MSDFIKKRNALFGATLVKNFNARNFETYYCETKADACEKALSLIEKNSSIAFGGSMSVAQCGLLEKLKSPDYNLIDRSNYSDIRLAYADTFTADTYLMSANGISQNGELVNIDGNGNRLSALCYGPKQVIVIASLNKVSENLDTAISRARNTAAPINAGRFPLSTPCTATGECSSCTCEDCICAQILVTRFCRPKGRIKIIFCGEDMGF